MMRISPRAQAILEEAVTADPNTWVKPNRLCSKCQAAISASHIVHGTIWNLKEFSQKNSLPQDLCEEFSHYKTFEDLEESAARSCHLCTLLRSSERIEILEEAKDHGDLSAAWSFRAGMYDGVLRITCTARLYQGQPRLQYSAITAGRPFSCTPQDMFTIHGVGIGVLDIKESRGRDGVPDIFRHQAQLSLSTASDASFQLANEWIETCVREHHGCMAAYNSASVLPTRLLDVGTSSDGRLRLVEGLTVEEDFTRPRYLTLSHRWPKEPIICLTEQNLESFRQGIPMDQLPPTFQHAVQITRRLNFHFLWIDSLCILQDSPSDWDRESTIMGDIYRGSVCTIAALKMDGIDSGCFSIRNPLSVLPCSLGVPRVVAGVFQNERRAYGELLTRGWVMQERVLSPRTIYYGSTDILWECTTAAASEGCPRLSGHWSMPQSYNPKQAFPLLVLENLPDLANPSGKFLSFHITWARMLNAYSRCALTKPEDKLVAVNGIMRDIEGKTGMHGVAGLWKEILPAELMWYSNETIVHTSDRLDLYRAPSWSWASLDGVITNDYVDIVRNKKFRLDWMLNVVSVELNAKSNGQVSHAKLTVDAPILGVLWPQSETINTKIPIPGYEGTPKNGYWIADRGRKVEGEVHVLLVARGTGSDLRSNDDDPDVFETAVCDIGIVLKKEEGLEDTHRRIGYFEQYYWTLGTHHLFATANSMKEKRIVLI